MQDRKNRKEESVATEDEQPATGESWKDRHGATLVAVAAVVMLAALIAFQMNC